MLQRSVPMYQECQDLAVHWCTKYAKPSTSVYDLGCSTGKFLLKLAEKLEQPKNIELIGLDNSAAMLKKVEETFNNSPLPCSIIETDLNKKLSIESMIHDTRLLDFSCVSGHTNSTQRLVKVACFQGNLTPPSVEEMSQGCSMSATKHLDPFRVLSVHYSLFR